MEMKELKEILPEKILEDVKKAFSEFSLTEEQKKKAMEKIAEIYKKSCYEPGEAIGVVTAQSISEPGTQLTMRSYQLAGAVEIKVTLGLPRLIEIFDARKTPTTPTMTIHLQKSYNTKEKAKKIASEIQEVRLSDLVENSYVDLLNMQIEFDFNESVMRSLNLNYNKIAVLLKESKHPVAVSGKKIVIKPKEEKSVKELQKLKTKILSLHMKGIKGISQAIVRQVEGEWVINTLGTNLAKVLELEGIDATRTTTNDINEIASVIGIEAARNAIVNEASRTLKEQGLEVDIRHILLMADVMTADGDVKPVGRYGVAGKKGSVLARANFEETIKHLTSASVKGEVDRLDSIVENVMINQVVPVGTGMFDLVFKPYSSSKEEK